MFILADDSIHSLMAAKQHSFFYRNGLSLAFLFLFLISLVGQVLTGWKEYNQTLTEEGAPAVTLPSYLTSGHFWQATFENWESEFLQMFLYVLLTVWLRQWGSSESKPLDEPDPVDQPPAPGPSAPWPVKRGGVWLTLYRNSLSLAFLVLFLLSWGFHAWGSFKDYQVEEGLKGQPVKDFLGFLGEPRFWFESFQNWQSEFLSVLSIVVLSIFLRQQGSPESKPVDTPDEENG